MRYRKLCEYFGLLRGIEVVARVRCLDVNKVGRVVGYSYRKNGAWHYVFGVRTEDGFVCHGSGSDGLRMPEYVFRKMQSEMMSRFESRDLAKGLRWSWDILKPTDREFLIVKMTEDGGPDES